MYLKGIYLFILGVLIYSTSPAQTGEVLLCPDGDAFNFRIEPPEFVHRINSDPTTGGFNCLTRSKDGVYFRMIEDHPQMYFSTLQFLDQNKDTIKLPKAFERSIGGVPSLIFSLPYNDSSVLVVYRRGAGLPYTAIPLPEPIKLQILNDSIASFAGLYYTLVRYPTDGRKAYIHPAEFDQRFAIGNFHNVSVFKTQGGKIWVSAYRKNAHYAYNLATLSSVNPTVTQNVLDHFPSNAPEIGYGSTTPSRFSPNGCHLLNYLQIGFFDSLNFVFYKTLPAKTLYLSSFDTTTGLVTNTKKIINYENQEDLILSGYFHFEFSPNSEYIYYLNMKPDREYQLFQVAINDANNPPQHVLLLRTNNDVRSISLASNQKIYIPFATPEGGKLDAGIIEYPNRKGATCKAYPYNRFFTPFAIQVYYFQQYQYHGINRDFSFQINCDSSIQFENKSELNKIQSFNWYFYDCETGALIDSSSAIHPTLKPYKDGRIFVKLLSHTSSGYSPWYSDTIDYSFPKVPKILVSYQDSIKCRFSSFTFTDNSNYGLPGKPEYQRWDVSFGDGHDTSFNGQISNLAYAYPDTGVFSIHLQLTDGYCMDSITLTPPVQIRDAPAPGIVADINEGCPVFETSVHRLRPDPIQGAAYSLNSGMSWMTLNRSPDNLDIEDIITIKSPGQYNVLVRLDGPSGCQTIDSVSIRVMQGFEPTDRMDWSYATTTEYNRVFIRWDSLYAAQYYRVFWDNDSSIALTDPSYTFQFEAEKEYAIHINAYDSCGKIIGSGPLENIWLEGINKENESLDLKWNYQASWLNPRFEINTKEDQLWKSLVSVPSSVYSHSDFVESGLNELCYYIQLEEGHVFADSIQSNRICVPLHPVIWIPNSFTPNQDGLNDVFSLYTLGITDLNLNVYNSFGQLIYSEQGPAVEWNGSFGGNPVQEGVYLYTLKTVQIDGRIKTYKGTITLLR